MIGINVVETPRLRQLHEMLNTDLERELGGTQADFDGAAYHFHLTLSIGQPDSRRYEKMLADLPGMEIDVQILLNGLALCLYERLKDGGREYGIYKRLILGCG